MYQEIKRKRILSKFKNVQLDIGTGVSLYNCDFGEYVYLGNNVSLESVKIGRHSYVNANTRIRHTSVGKFCCIGANAKIGLGIHPTDLISSHPSFYSTNKNFKTFADRDYYKEYETVDMGNDVWIGENAVIMGGLRIGDGAIIAAGAVVTKNVEPYAIVGGVPAKKIRFRFSDDDIERIRRTGWWDKEEEWFQKNHHLFRNPDKFFEHFEKK
jgi:acetyltransferase-like isoleucine patch superfamily enzyme